MQNLSARYKNFWFLAMVGYFITGYMAINRSLAGRDGFFDVSSYVDSWIPFIPVFIFGYILVYLSILIVYLTIKDRALWNHTVIAFFLSTSLAYIFFVVMPVQMTLRPDMAGAAGIGALVTKWYYIIDMPYNCFPSLHVTYPALATILVWKSHLKMRWVLLAMTFIVAISVLLVKQHYIADVIGGLVNAVLCYWVVYYLNPRHESRDSRLTPL